jgi:TonB family protein
MFSSSTLPLNSRRVKERRGRLREPLRGTVLVFFGNRNWGKLIEMNEEGMSFEFAHLPSLRQRVNFTFEVLGSRPTPHVGKSPSESFEATGEILWTRGFERIAGVRFVGMAETQRRQIRWWISCREPLEEPAQHQEVNQGLQTAMVEPSESLASHSETALKAEVEPASEGRNRIAELEPESGPRHAAEAPEALQLDDSLVSVPKEPRKATWKAGSNLPLARIALIGMSGIAVALVASARMIRVASREPAEPLNRASVGPTRPLQVEVVDARGRRWLLWFVREGEKKGVDPLTLYSVRLSRSFPVSARTPIPTEGTAEKNAPVLDYASVRTNVARPRINGSAQALPSTEAPPLSTELSVPFDESITNALSSPKPPAPATETGYVRSIIQEARLTKSEPPDYPELAKSTHVSGDVVMDAVIDAAGNVKSVRVISGPPLLQRAAVDALRQWKYEPARLDGQPIAVHLTVTLNFRLR